MNDYVISCCTPVDYTKEALAELGVETVFYHILLDGEDYADDFGESISAETLRMYLVAGHDVKTSQVSVGEYLTFFRPFLEAGRDILHITLSSGLSGTLNSATLASRAARLLLHRPHLLYQGWPHSTRCWYPRPKDENLSNHHR